MTKLLKWIGIVLVVIAIGFSISVAADREQLNSGIIRLHVVAQSDSETDQEVKLWVRDAVMAYLEENMPQMTSSADAKEYLNENLYELQKVAESVLKASGMDYGAEISLQKEAFDVRHYDTFSLPSGVYESLHIRLGDAQGKNWWCVVFPSLCLQASAGQEDVSAFSDTLNDTLENKEGYRLRFFLLDWLGNLEKLFFIEEK